LFVAPARMVCFKWAPFLEETEAETGKLQRGLASAARTHGRSGYKASDGIERTALI